MTITSRIGAPTRDRVMLGVPPDPFFKALIAATKPPRRRRRGRWLLAGLAVMLVAGGISMPLALRGDEAPAFPERWDPAVRSFAKLVEQGNGLKFTHPVYVDFLTPRDFVHQSHSDDIDLLGQDRPAIDRDLRLLRALGLVSGTPDLYNSDGRLRGAGVNGSYSYVTQRIRLRGTQLTPAVQWALVHELTHALQDQHFDIRARLQDMAGEPARREVFQALLEGDATRTQEAWAKTVDDQVRLELEDDKDAVRSSNTGAGQVPLVFRFLAGAPHAFGPSLMSVVLTAARPQGGTHAVESLFLTPPTTQEQLLDPWSLVADHQGSLVVPEPLVAPDEERFDAGTFGAISWLVVLAERLPPLQALAAADGWGGDAFVAFEREGNDCIKIRYAGDTEHDVVQMHAALKKWVAGAPEGSASVVADGERLLLEACVAGASQASAGSGRSGEAVALAISRTRISIQLVRAGVDVDVARCASEGLIRALRPSRLEAPLNVEGQSVQRQIAPCRPSGLT